MGVQLWWSALVVRACASSSKDVIGLLVARLSLSLSLSRFPERAVHCYGASEPSHTGRTTFDILPSPSLHTLLLHSHFTALHCTSLVSLAFWHECCEQLSTLDPSSTPRLTSRHV